MHFISSILFAVSANIDNFIIGISYGVKEINIPFSSNLIIGLITLIGTIISIILGEQLSHLIVLEKAQIIGSILLIIMGLYYIIKFFIKQKGENNTNESNDQFRNINEGTIENNTFTDINIKEVMAIGFALTLNNIGLGVGASISGIKLISTSIITFLISMLFLFLGNKIGKSYISKFIKTYADPIAGIIIIALGVYEFFI